LKGNILDIGCGYGFRTISLVEIIQGSLLGIDIDVQRIRGIKIYDENELSD